MDFDLSKKVGPLPLGAWIAIVVGGLAIGFYINRNQAVSDSTDEEVPIGDSDVGRGGSLTPDPPVWGEGDDESDDGYEDNAAWGRDAVDYLIGTGQDPSDSDQAVRKYLEGLSLSVNERSLINMVLRELGPAPEPIASVPEDEDEDEDEDTGNGIPNTPGWGSDVPLSLKLAFPSSRVREALTKVTGSDHGTHINMVDLRSGLKAIGHDPGSEINVGDVLEIIQYREPKTPGVANLKAPSSTKAGRSFVVRGITTLNGRAAAISPVRVDLLRDDGSWKPHTQDGGGGDGHFTIRLMAGKRGETRRYRIEVWHPPGMNPGPRAKIARKQFTVRFT